MIRPPLDHVPAEPTVIRSPWPAITYVALLYVAAIGVFLWAVLT